ncbi:MAG: hypothetical protein EB107_14315 [Proteobacteria bacterium]|nr:hypothetical protein [Pseudomonadota bacterium]NDF96985.1 hypothetical protein [Pseudomonadota bacterium]
MGVPAAAGQPGSERTGNGLLTGKSERRTAHSSFGVNQQDLEPVAVCLDTITRQPLGICRVAGLLPGSDRVPALYDRPMAGSDIGKDVRGRDLSRHGLARADLTDADVSK